VYNRKPEISGEGSMGLKPLPTFAEFVPKMMVRTWPFLAGSLLFGVPLVIKARNTSRTFPLDRKLHGDRTCSARSVSTVLRACRPHELLSPGLIWDAGVFGGAAGHAGEERPMGLGSDHSRGADGVRASQLSCCPAPLGQNPHRVCPRGTGTHESSHPPR